jgi:hypothetical protein
MVLDLEQAQKQLQEFIRVWAAPMKQAGVESDVDDDQVIYWLADQAEMLLGIKYFDGRFEYFTATFSIVHNAEHVTDTLIGPTIDAVLKDLIASYKQSIKALGG